MRRLMRMVRSCSLLLKARFETLVDEMSGTRRNFVNIYQQSEADRNLDIEKSLNRVKEDLDHVVQRIVSKKPYQRASTDGGLYVGAAGIAYTFLRLSRCSFLSADNSKKYLSLAQRYLQSSLETVELRGNRINTAFLLGDSGPFAVGAVLATAYGNNSVADKLAKNYAQMAETFKEMHYLKCGSDEFFVGRTGFLYGALWLNRELSKSVVPIEAMHQVARTIVESGKIYARKYSSACPLMYKYYDTEYLGAAHGLSSILQVLIQVPGFLDSDASTESIVRTSVDYLLSLQTSSGNFPCATVEIDTSGRSSRSDYEELVHWCHGGPGVIYLMAAAYLRWKDEKYLNSCRHIGELVWKKGLLKKGPGICHGVAGNGYVFLILYRLTNEILYLNRAHRFAEFMNTPQFLREARTPDDPYSLYEGIAGTACFLADLIEPDKAAFPFQDVF